MKALRYYGARDIRHEGMDDPELLSDRDAIVLSLQINFGLRAVVEFEFLDVVRPEIYGGLEE